MVISLRLIKAERLILDIIGIQVNNTYLKQEPSNRDSNEGIGQSSSTNIVKSPTKRRSKQDINDLDLVELKKLKYRSDIERNRAQIEAARLQAEVAELQLIQLKCQLDKN
jgi:hypothetical protein